MWVVADELGIKIAKITNKALMGKNKTVEEKGEEAIQAQDQNDNDKLDKLKRKHLHPNNIEIYRSRMYGT